MGRRAKEIKPRIEQEIDGIGELERITRSINGNNHSSEGLSGSGQSSFYWNYQGVLFFNNHFGSDGFSKEDVEKIAVQVKKASSLSAKLCQEQYVLVGGKRKNFMSVLMI